MKSVSLAVALSLFAGGALAQTRATTTTMSCDAAASLVQARGAVVLYSTPDIFDRFVRDASFCPHGQVLKPAFTPARDRAQCFVGYRCYEEEKQVR